MLLRNNWRKRWRKDVNQLADSINFKVGERNNRKRESSESSVKSAGIDSTDNEW